MSDHATTTASFTLESLYGAHHGWLMTPADFRSFVCRLADSLDFSQDMLILGGDHLGPNRWQNLPAEQAMANATSSPWVQALT